MVPPGGVLVNYIAVTQLAGHRQHFEYKMYCVTHQTGVCRRLHYRRQQFLYTINIIETKPNYRKK